MSYLSKNNKLNYNEYGCDNNMNEMNSEQIYESYIFTFSQLKDILKEISKLLKDINLKEKSITLKNTFLSFISASSDLLNDHKTEIDEMEYILEGLDKQVKELNIEINILSKENYELTIKLENIQALLDGKTDLKN